MRRWKADSVNARLALEAQAREDAAVAAFAEQVERQKQLQDFVGDKPARKRRPRFDLGGKLAEVEEMVKADPTGSNGVWQEAKPGHLVALFARWFRQTYGVEDSELRSAGTASKACTQAARLAESEFGGDPRGVVRYLAWLFQRAREWEARAREEERADPFRVTWYYALVGRKALTDYRLHLRRTTGEGR